MASSARQHAEWLSLIEVSGPFLGLPALMRAFPQGLDAHNPDRARSLHLAYDEWGENRHDRAIHRQWTRYVLTHLLEFPTEQLQDGPAIPEGLTVTVAEQGETLRPDVIVRRAERDEAARLLITVVPPTQGLDAPLGGAHWKASPATRMAELLRGTGVPLGLVTNGERWMLVHAPRGETAGFASWYASLWFDEAITLRAFRSLLEAGRFFGVSDKDTLEALLVESAANQQEVTDQLGTQVRQAVEVLVRTLDSLDRDAGRALLADLPPAVIYEAALTVMIRLVFLFSAEERGLLRLGDPLYDQFYAVSTLRAQLRADADRNGEEVLERRSDAWSRLLATFRAVYGGIGHEDLRLPAYGGDLFDPDRFPFLEGRAAGTSWRDAVAAPLAIDNRTVLHLLEALQVLRVKVPGGPAEPRLLSFRALDIEQIGHVYEGLLDHTAKYATEPMLGLTVSGDLKKVKRPDMPLAELEALRAKGDDALLATLKEATGRSENALRKDLDAELTDLGHAAVRTACDNDADLTARVVPFAGLVRADSFGRPQVIPAGSVFVTAGTDRRATGTHYTPRSLTEPIIKHTLDPLVFHGPAEGLPEAEWTLRPAAELLRLTVCDMAMGSGAFLVQACRYLSERLVEAWERAEEGSGGRVVVTPEGDLSTGAAEEQPLPRDAEERLAVARRIVADHCLYGVDKNPLAVEMGKLSLWLITLQKDRPFTFLDHRLRCGDSLLGVDIAQLTHWSLRPEHGPQQRFITKPLEDSLKDVRALRNKISGTTVIDARDADEKARLLQNAEEAMALVRLGADLLIAAVLTSDPRDRERLNDDLMVRYTLTLNAMDEVRAGRFTSEGEMNAREAFAQLRAEADNLLGENRPFHWPLEFPEVFSAPIDTGNLPGFAAIVGNPPFMGGSKITGALGTPYRDYLVDVLAEGARGNADLCAYFFLRAMANAMTNGGLGLLATNTIAQGSALEVGLQQLLARGATVTRAVASERWPGEASLEVAHIWVRRGAWEGPQYLNGESVNGINANLSEPGMTRGNPHQLQQNMGMAYEGSKVYGKGFVLTPEDASLLIERDERNQDVLSHYLSGEDLNSRPDQSPSRWVINFHDWGLEKAKGYAECFAIIEKDVKPERNKLSATNPARKKWWQYERIRSELYSAIIDMKRVLITAKVGAHHCFALSETDRVFSNRLVVLTLEGYDTFAILSSTVHDAWAHREGTTTHETRNTYFPVNALENYPFPSTAPNLIMIGERYYAHRQAIMQARQEGLTKTYNRFHDSHDLAVDIERLRGLHREMDATVMVAYGWDDLVLDHGFHTTKQGVRFTISEPARREVLDRLLALNHARYAEEVAAGLHAKKTAKAAKGKRTGGVGTTAMAALPFGSLDGEGDNA